MKYDKKKFLSPYKVITFHGDWDYVIEDAAGNQEVVHYNRLEFHVSRQTVFGGPRSVDENLIPRAPVILQVTEFNLAGAQHMRKNTAIGYIRGVE